MPLVTTKTWRHCETGNEGQPGETGNSFRECEDDLVTRYGEARVTELEQSICFVCLLIGAALMALFIGLLAVVWHWRAAIDAW